ncbi:hypothetical protein NL676_004605 [Syzygium grande]|nr:hypothetical protein NL676_004605 [Syzygium grande]
MPWWPLGYRQTKAKESLISCLATPVSPGKLARTWFRSVDQLSMNVGDPHYDPLYPFGFGLTTKGTKQSDPTIIDISGPKMATLPFLSMGMILFLCYCSAIAGTAPADQGYSKYKDPCQPVNARIRDLMQRMTLQEKIGQMTQVDYSVVTPITLSDYSIGSVLSGGGSVPFPKAKARDWMDMVNKYQNDSLSSRLRILIIYGIDAVHGHNNVYQATIFPHNVGLGAARDPDLVRGIGTATALEVRATGINYVFAQCIDVCRDPRWGRCYESYGEDLSVVQAMKSIILPARKSDKVLACAKHYVGDGGTTRGINENNTVIDWHGLLSIHCPVHAIRFLVTDFLKNILKFKGFVISDWQGINKITTPIGTNYTYSVQMGIEAGIDMVTVPYNHTIFIDTLTQLVNANVIPTSRIDDAVKRISRVKFVMGLFENPMGYQPIFPSLEARDLAREAVRKSLVLLKNGHNADALVLPLAKNAPKIVVTGTHANNLGYQCGGWTITWQGGSGNNLTSGTTILGATSKAMDLHTEVVFSENPNTDFVKSHNFSYAITVRELPYVETAGDNTNLTLAEPGKDIISNVCSSVKCVVIVVSGRPVMMEPLMAQMDALVVAWLPGSNGEGVADALFGDYGFTGKSPMTWFKTVDQLPMNVGDPHYDPLFPFGFGLTTEPTGGQ